MSATEALLLGYDEPADAAPYFDQCTQPGVIDDGVGLDNNERGAPVLPCRPTMSWTELWPKLRHYN